MGYENESWYLMPRHDSTTVNATIRQYRPWFDQRRDMRSRAGGLGLGHFCVILTHRLLLYMEGSATGVWNIDCQKKNY